MSAHPKIKRGSQLDAHPVELIFRYDPVLLVLNQQLQAAGYERPDSVKPRVGADGRISVKIVWRNDARDSVTRCARFNIVGA